jgi:hypothetical protein
MKETFQYDKGNGRQFNSTDSVLIASLVELADTIDLGSIAARFESSSLSGGTKNIWLV